MQKIRTAIIGQGRSGRDIHGAHLSTDTERYQIVAAVDPLPDRRNRAQAEYGCDVYTDYTALLEREDLDLVVNAAPSKFHVPISLSLLEAGYNVLCEKPLASGVLAVDRLIAAAERSGKMLAIFQQSRFAPCFRKIREVIDSGVLGEVVQVSIVYSGFSRRYDWQTLTSEMGGSLLNTGPHPLDQALQFFGGGEMPRVHCIMRNATSYGDAEDHVLLILSGERRPLIEMEISSCARYPHDMYNICATRGGLKGSSRSIEWQYYDPQTARPLELTRTPLHQADGTPAYCSDKLEWHTEQWSAPEGQGLFATMSHDFYSMLYRSLTEGQPLEVTPQQVRRQIAVIEECHRQNPHIYPLTREGARP